MNEYIQWKIHRTKSAIRPLALAESCSHTAEHNTQVHIGLVIQHTQQLKDKQ